MKYIVSVLLLLNAINVFTQNYSLPEMQGLESPGGYTVLEVSGYDIYIDRMVGNLKDPGIVSVIVLNLGIGTVLNEYQDNEFKVANKIIEAETIISTYPHLRTAQACYLLQESDSQLISIQFVTINERNPILERAIVEEYLKNKLTPYIHKGISPKSFYFLGRSITPKEEWEMTTPHAVTGEGVQIRWSEFKTLEQADSDIQNRLMLDKNDMQVVVQRYINVVFEGVPTQATRVVYKDEDSDYPLIAYYLAQEIRERYVSCILSNYGHNENDYYLNALLGEVMTIPQPPANAFRLPPQQASKPAYIQETESVYDPPNFFDVQLGTRIPVGNLSNIYSSAVLLAVYIKMFSVKSTMFDIGIQVGFPSGAKDFNYYYTKNAYDYDTTKAEVLLNFSVRARREISFRSNLRMQYYLGMGYESLSTDLYKNTSYDDNGNEIDHNYAVRSMDFYGGINLKHKYVGLFLEYHFTPYPMFYKVPSGFGSSAIHAGILITL